MSLPLPVEDGEGERSSVPDTETKTTISLTSSSAVKGAKEVPPDTIPEDTEPAEEKTIEVKGDAIKVEFTVESKLGTGSYSTVYAVRTSKGELKALKVPLDPLGVYASVGIENLLEVDVLTRMDHEHIINAEAFYCDAKGVSILMPMAQLSLFSAISNNRLSVDERVKIAYQVTCGLEFLLRQNILHLDIKAANILLFANPAGSADRFTPRICDFNLATRIEDRSIPIRVYRSVITEQCRPRENLGTSNRYGEASIVWQLGTLFMFMFGECLPERGKDPKAYIQTITEYIDRYFKERRRAVLKQIMIDVVPSESLLTSLVDLMYAMLDPDPEKRCSMAFVLRHPVFKQFSYIDGKVKSVAPPKPLNLSVSLERLMNQFELAQLPLNVSGGILFTAIDLLYRSIDLVQNEDARTIFVHSLTCCYMAWKLYEHRLPYGAIYLEKGKNSNKHFNSFLLHHIYTKRSILAPEVRLMETNILHHVDGKCHNSYVWDACTDSASVLTVFCQLLKDPTCYPSLLEYLPSVVGKVEEKPTLQQLLATRPGTL